MALRGKGMLVVYCEVKSRDERDLNEWYNREHIDERLDAPGLNRARRYVALSGSPKYLATYECDHVSDLAANGYLKYVANPTPWTRAVTARFTKFKRLTVRVQVDLAHGAGGIVTTVRFVPDPHKGKALVAWLEKTALPRAIKRPDLVGAFAVENDLDVANAPQKSRSMDHPRVEEAEWVVFLEGADPAATAAAARQTLTLASLKRFGVTTAPAVGTYRLLFGNDAPAKRRD